MKILAISDVESAVLWDEGNPYTLKDVDLVLSCGDLHPAYLSFIATYTHAPVLYVHGNHDGCYEQTPPLGCVCVEDRIYHHNGLRILGLGGSMRYNRGPHQYTESEMARRIRKLRFTLWRNRGFDILLTHAPAFGMGDGKDLAHQGFQAFHRLVNTYQPFALIHGHTHLNYGHERKRILHMQQTQVVNAYERYLLTI